MRSFALGLCGLALLLAACGGGEDSPTETGNNNNNNGTEIACAATLFTAIPVQASQIAAVTVVGGMGAPSHTVPTDHVGLYLTQEGVSVFSPGAIRVTQMDRVSYIKSSFRQGRSDYGLRYTACKDVGGTFGHITTLSSAFPSSIVWTGCSTRTTADETVESCSASVDIALTAGQLMGTGGFGTALAIDFGVQDTRVTNRYVNAARFAQSAVGHAVCPFEYYDATTKATILAKVMDKGRPDLPAASGEPRCGTMQVDSAGTAKGVWADPAGPSVHGADESRYVALANYPYLPQQKLSLAVGPAELGAFSATVPRQTSGRVNRAFEQVVSDGLIYCYGPGEFLYTGSSWFVSLAANGTLKIERKAHADGVSPCAGDPSSWAFGAGAMTLVR